MLGYNLEITFRTYLCNSESTKGGQLPTTAPSAAELEAKWQKEEEDKVTKDKQKLEEEEEEKKKREEEEEAKVCISNCCMILYLVFSFVKKILT